jgi:hypothetical protein
MIPMMGNVKSSRSAEMSGCAEKQATSAASTYSIQVERSREQRARIHASEDKIASVADSIAEGEGCGAVKPITVQPDGREDLTVETQAAVIVGVEFGFTRRILMLR